MLSGPDSGAIPFFVALAGFQLPDLKQPYVCAAQVARTTGICSEPDLFHSYA